MFCVNLPMIFAAGRRTPNFLLRCCMFAPLRKSADDLGEDNCESASTGAGLSDREIERLAQLKVI
jgi:hypothetical protein